MENNQNKLSLLNQWLSIGNKNRWIASAYDPPFTLASFRSCSSIEELQAAIGEGNWSLGTAFYLGNLCFINQIDGGDEWLVIRDHIAFESCTFGGFIERGIFFDLINRFKAATDQQLRELSY